MYKICGGSFSKWTKIYRDYNILYLRYKKDKICWKQQSGLRREWKVDEGIKRQIQNFSIPIQDWKQNSKGVPEIGRN